MSQSTQLSPASEEKLIAEVSETISNREYEALFKKFYGINKIKKEGKRLVIYYNPLIFSADSIRQILARNNVKIELN